LNGTGGDFSSLPVEVVAEVSEGTLVRGNGTVSNALSDVSAAAGSDSAQERAKASPMDRMNERKGGYERKGFSTSSGFSGSRPIFVVGFRVVHERS
jgi:hypothetical protein